MAVPLPKINKKKNVSGGPIVQVWFGELKRVQRFAFSFFFFF